MAGLLRRYSPLIVLGVIQLVVVLLAPSGPPGQASIQNPGTVPTAVGVQPGTVAGGATSAGSAQPGATAGQQSAGGSGTAPGTTTSATGPVRVGNAVVGSGSTAGVVSSCPGTQPAPWAYMPPCLHFNGKNGGATMDGVTSTAINYVWYEGVAPPALAAVGNSTGLTYTKDQLCEALTAYTKVVNKRWELYGRHLVPLNGPGSHSGYAQGSNCHFPYYQGDNCSSTDSACWRAQADVIAAMKPKPAFVIGGVEVTVPFLDELAKKHILVLGQGSADSFVQPRGPYVWDWQMSIENVASFGSEYFCKKLVGHPVKYAGSEVLHSGKGLSTPQRKIAIVYDVGVPDTFSAPAKAFVQSIEHCGATGVSEFPFAADVSTLPQSMQAIAAKIKLGGFTTVYGLMDPISAIPLSTDLDSEQWHPEFVIAGAGAIDDDLLGQLMNQNEWKYAFGLSLRKFQAAPQTWDYYKAYKDSGATDEPMKLALNMWPYFWMAGDMFQVAGPSPSIGAIQAGMFNLPLLPGHPENGAMKFGVPGDSYLGQRDVREVWWCPTTKSPKNGQSGSYISVLGDRRFQHGQIDGTMRVFPNGTCA